MHPADQSRAMWRKSSYSNGSGGSCVEVATVSRKDTGSDGRQGRVEIIPLAGFADDSEHQIAVRDSKDPQGPMLAFTAGEWREFAAEVKAGDFDLA